MTGTTIRRSLLGVAGIFAALLGTGHAHAGYSVCRTDPTVYLSDGYTVVMYADISDTLSDVKHVYYTLHVPHGVSATKVVYDSTGYLESVSVVADQTSGGYCDTEVVTGTSGIPVTVHASIQGVASGSISGYSGQHLVLHYWG